MVHYVIHDVRWDSPMLISRAAFEDMQMLVYNFFWTHCDEGGFMPPVIVEPSGLEAVVGHSYVPHQRPPHVFDGPPHLHITADAIRISKLTHVHKDTLDKFMAALHALVAEHSTFFGAGSATSASNEHTFGDATPEHIRTFLRDKPRLSRCVNDFLSARGMSDDTEFVNDASVVLSDPAQGGMATLEQFDAMLAQGRL